MKTSSNIALTTSDSRFMDQNLMLDYVDRVILPHTRFITPDGSIDYHPSLLILDDFSAHKVQKDFYYMRKFKILPFFIPGGYTFCAQPLDVVLNRPFKCNLRVYYEDHQFKHQYSKNGNVVKPSWQETVDMVDMATKSLTPDLIRKSFVRCGLNLSPSSYFEKFFNRLNPVLKSFFDYENICWDLDYELLSEFKKSLVCYKYAWSFERACEMFTQPYNEEATQTFPHTWDAINNVASWSFDEDVHEIDPVEGDFVKEILPKSFYKLGPKGLDRERAIEDRDKRYEETIFLVSKDFIFDEEESDLEEEEDEVPEDEDIHEEENDDDFEIDNLLEFLAY